MKTISRVASVVTGLALAMAATLGLASSASAAYSSTPTGPVGWTPDGNVHAVLAVGDRVYVGGTFTGGVAALTSTGDLLWTGTANGDVRALALSSDGSRLFAGGNFTAISGVTHRRLASLDPSNGTAATTWKASVGGTVRDLVVDGDTLYFGGTFSAHDGMTQRGLGAVLGSTGKAVTTFTPSTDNNVFGLAKSGSNLIVAGSFTSVTAGATTVSRNSLASIAIPSGNVNAWNPVRVCSGCNQYWDVVVDATSAYVGTSGNALGGFSLTTGLRTLGGRAITTNGDVQALALSGGQLLAGGHFTTFAGQPRTILAAVSVSTGALDPSFVPRFVTTYPGIWALAPAASGLWTGGHFTAAGPTPPKKYPFLAFFPNA